MYYKSKKIIYFSIILPISYLLIFELILRVTIFLFTFNLTILVYGIDKNITLTLHSISKGEFYITDASKIINRIVGEKEHIKDQIWIFGGSTSNKGFCDSKNLSWVDYLETNLKKKNFSRNGVNSDFSLNVLRSELEKSQVPKTIIWANKVNEILHSKRNNSTNDNIIINLHSIRKSIKNYMVTFYFFDELSIRLFDKIGINLRYEKKLIQEKDLIFSSNEFFKNTKEAILLSNLNGVEKFIIVSLFNKSNLESSESRFYYYYLEKVERLLKNFNNVYFIDTKKMLDINDKKLDLFCDSMHQNYSGKKLVGKIISNYLNENR
ncbi:MAG: hypothetical protein CMI79_00805 [Candidatus Pelagibacter sp.]|nr:hypothetical protein [Candidatus Pelagibacter sp.]|tara:strand:+ start:909 stop:1874 length:966 start_codon:yes stop_codon:yes gene_type:complete